MDALCESLTSVLGMPVGHVKMVVCILLSYPCAILWRMLPSRWPSLKHLLSIAYAFTTLVVFLEFHIGTAQIGLTAMGTYLITKFYRSPMAPWVNFAFVMASMSVCHIDRQIKGYKGDETMDYSGALMVAVIKLSSFGFNVADGRGQPAMEYHRKMKVNQFPSLLEYFGWICFFGGLLSGPPCEFMEYLRFANHQEADPKLSPWKPAAKRLAESALCGVIVATLSPTYYYARMLTPEMASQSFIKKFFFINVCGYMIKLKYFCAWLMAEGSCVLCGLGFNGYDAQGQARWDRVTNVNLWTIERSQSIKRYSIEWNSSTGRWLKQYVYVRLLAHNLKPKYLSFFITYVISSMWHGFYAGYYLMLSVIPFFQLLGERIRRCVRPLTLTPEGKHPLPFWKTAYDVAGWFFTHTVISILTAPFQLLYFSDTMRVYRDIYYVHMWVLGIGFIGCTVLEPTLFAWQKRRVSILPKEPATTESTLKDLDVASVPKGVAKTD